MLKIYPKQIHKKIISCFHDSLTGQQIPSYWLDHSEMLVDTYFGRTQAVRETYFPLWS